MSSRPSLSSTTSTIRHECHGDESSQQGVPLSIIQKVELDLYALLDISFEYEILFLQSGATTLFLAISLNLVKPDNPVCYLAIGSWDDKAFKEAQQMGGGRVTTHLPQ